MDFQVEIQHAIDFIARWSWKVKQSGIDYGGLNGQAGSSDAL